MLMVAVTEAVHNVVKLVVVSVTTFVPETEYVIPGALILK